MSERVSILGADGKPLGWTYDGEQYRLVRESVLDAMAALADDSGVVPLKDVVAYTQDRLGADPLFPSGRLTNAVRYVAADLRGRGVLERVGASSPQLLRVAEAP